MDGGSSWSCGDRQPRGEPQSSRVSTSPNLVGEAHHALTANAAAQDRMARLPWPVRMGAHGFDSLPAVLGGTSIRVGRFGGVASQG